MRLKQIKLAGFKSFVEPTKIPFPAQMTAIVGPNGCGKSNVIDAVRWVLGESSAKNLRGDAMTDVIFNGSASRKPISVASVELQFDNSQKSLTGPYAAFNEVAVKRQVSRDGQSNYFLNGQRCRRRDITDLFSGTGLGPRSYAIIEQGTISRLIESRPQELRVFIEEAAGISKYKDRRKETETRIRNSRENLERLGDISGELEQQLDKLKAQSEDARRYTELKKHERQLKAELVVLRWQQFSRQHQVLKQQLQEQQNVLIQHQTQINSQQLKRSATAEGLAQLKHDRDQQQKAFYQLGADISRLEQSLLHLRQQGKKLDGEIAEEHLHQRQLHQEQLELEQQKQQVMKTLAASVPKLPLLQQQQEQLQENWQEAQQQAARYTRQWQQQLEQQGEIAQEYKLAQQQEQGIVKQLERLTAEQHRVTEKLQELQQRAQELVPDQLRSQSDGYTKEHQAIAERVKQISDELGHERQQQQDVYESRSQCQGELQQLEAEKTSLTTLQSGLMPGEDPWLTQQQLEQAGWLWQKVVAEPGLELALETVLGPFLNARCVEMLTVDDHANPAQRHYLLERDESLHAAKERQGERSGRLIYPLLVDQITSAWAVDALLHDIYVAEDLAQAKKISQQLIPGESVITPQGVWLGPGFAVLGQGGDDQGPLRIESQLRQLTPMISTKSQQLKQLKREYIQTQSDIDARKLLLKNTHLAREQLLHQQQQCEKQLLLQEHQQQQLFEQQDELVQQQLQNVTDKKALEEEQAELNKRVEHLRIQHQQMEKQSQGLQQAKNRFLEAEQECQQLLTKGQQQLHQMQMLIQKDQLAQQGLDHRLAQQDQQLQRHRQKLAQLTEQLESLEEPRTQESQQLQQLLKQRTDQEKTVNQLNNQIGELDRVLLGFDKSQKSHNTREQQLSKRIERTTLECQALEIKANTQLEQLTEHKVGLEQVQATLSPGANEKTWQAELLDTTGKINQLGPINLAAIDEYQSQMERQGYLVRQMDDLRQALETLESAIRKIDRESRVKFKSTYEAINDGLANLFPKVFGGGSASLALTDDDMLNAGVTIMARPPGKKNSTIHLLSGGEKALTALSLVFAIFQLNPAPFCMLDEVDAPLDDANVERFCKLVGGMSDKVQFIYISHNKVSMEMATHLTGVTMQEPGVSRMVAVDIDEALAMADA